MGARVRLALLGAGVLLLAALPGVASAVRPSVSPLAQGEWTGSDPAGPVKFFVLLADNEQPSGRAFFTYGISGMKFATECDPQGHKVPGQIGITQHRVRRSQHPRFSFHGHGVVIHGVITGSLGGPTISGTVQIDTPECDGDVMPFTTHSAH